MGIKIRPAATAANMPSLHICIAHHFHATAGMGNGASSRRTDLVRIFPQITTAEGACRRLPTLLALSELALAELDIERPIFGVEHDHVAVAKERDRTATCRLGADMADTEAARGTREAPIGDQRELVAHALAVERRRSRQHLAHAGATLRAL